MENGYRTVAEAAERSFEEKRSKFIGSVTPCTSEEEALAFIERVRSTYPDAKHHVYAYCLRAGHTARFSDDHEPQGTAGLPVLDVIRKSGLTDTAVVVTRYFGGVLLGTGGLLRAYTRAAREAIDASGILQYETVCPFSLDIDYPLYNKILPLITCPDIKIENTDFSSAVSITGILRADAREGMEKLLGDASGGSAKVRFGDERFDCMKINL